jgi:hypothetical protein
MNEMWCFLSLKILFKSRGIVHFKEQWTVRSKIAKKHRFVRPLEPLNHVGRGMKTHLVRGLDTGLCGG